MPDKPFLEFFLKVLENWDSKIFRGPRALGKKSKNQKKSIFLKEILLFLAESLLYKFSAFFWDIYHLCSSKFEILTIFGLRNFIFDHQHLTARSRKSIPHRGLVLVSMESQRPKYLSGTMFRVVRGLWVNLWRRKKTWAIMAPPWNNVCSRPREE